MTIAINLLPVRATQSAALQRDGRHSAAFTLVELLVAATISLVMMGSVATLLGVFTRTASDSQSIVEMSARLRTASQQLRRDLTGITATLLPPLNPDSGSGYFEIVEGPWTDAVNGAGQPISGASSILGDTDDILAFTTRSQQKPHQGRFATGVIESSVAEVLWFCRPSPASSQVVPGLNLQTLYRRQALIVAYVGAGAFQTSTANRLTATLPGALTDYDISLRSEGTFLVPNSLSDLLRRENRLFHWSNWKAAPDVANAVFDLSTGREGEDVILNNVIGFDVRVFDPDARPRVIGSSVVNPNDQGYASPTAAPAPYVGCFLDLGRSAGGTVLASPGNARSQLVETTYDTWSTHPESNGIDDDSDGIIDQGTNGEDENGNGLPDDPAEAELPAPFSVRLLAIEVCIRCYDPASKQIRQTTVRSFFGH